MQISSRNPQALTQNGCRKHVAASNQNHTRFGKILLPKLFRTGTTASTTTVLVVDQESCNHPSTQLTNLDSGHMVNLSDKNLSHQLFHMILSYLISSPKNPTEIKYGSNPNALENKRQRKSSAKYRKMVLNAKGCLRKI